MSKSRRKTRRQKQEQNKRRFDAIKDLMSTFAMSTVAVVAVVVFVPSSPKAEITKAVALSEEVTYQVNVTDEDNALDLSTLTVVLENQLEYYEQPITLGQSSGFFENLQSDTEYRLSVYGSKGFGQERLDTLMITTQDRVGGTILSVVPQGDSFEPSYLIDLYVNDPESKYTAFTLYYGYQNEWEEEMTYSSMNVVDPNIAIEVFDIFTQEVFHVYLEGTTLEGTELLDEMWVTPPFSLYAELYLEYINNREIGFYVYGDMYVGETTYEMKVYQNNVLIQTKRVTSSSDHYEGNEFSVDGLKPGNLYYFECVAIYTHPQTLRTEQETIYQQELTTLEEYTYTYTIEEIGENLEVTITVTDPSHLFQIPYYTVYDMSEEHPMYLNGEEFAFTNNGETKTVTFFIPIPMDTTYKILIGMKSDTQFTINQIIEIIINE